MHYLNLQCLYTLTSSSVAVGKTKTNSKLLRLSILLICITRNSSGDEIANVNFLYDDIVHALKIQ